MVKLRRPSVTSSVNLLFWKLQDLLGHAWPKHVSAAKEIGEHVQFHAFWGICTKLSLQMVAHEADQQHHQAPTHQVNAYLAVLRIFAAT